MRRLSEEEQEQIGRASVKEVPYYYCMYCNHHHSRPGLLYQEHLPFRNTDKGIMICSVIKGGRL